MSKKIEDEAAAAATPAKAAKTKPAKKPARARAKTKASDANGFDFVGKVESIVVKRRGRGRGVRIWPPGPPRFAPDLQAESY